MTIWPPVISQIGYPGAGDIDDCAIVATVWAATASDPTIHKPTVTAFRKAAGVPDHPNHPDGLDNQECYDGSVGIWPHLACDPYAGGSWAPFREQVRAGRPASVAVRSSLLPLDLRFGFLGPHRVGYVWSWEHQRFELMNPLDHDGAALKGIDEADMKRAATGLLPGGRVIALLYDKPESQAVHLRYGAKPTVPFPDLTKTGRDQAPVYTRPGNGAPIHHRYREQGHPFIAYQVVHKDGSNWFGNRTGDRWMRGEDLTGEGGLH